jgi:hypothetical protein
MQADVQREYDVLIKAYVPDGSNQAIPDGYESYLKDCARIAVFLRDTEAVFSQLKYLNTLLLEEAKKQGLNVNAPVPFGFLQHKKVLRNVLERELAMLGFQPDFGKAKGFLAPATFRSALAEGLIVKDPGVSIEHGEFTHAIQWLVIGWQQKSAAFLDKSVIELFKLLGDERSVFAKASGTEKNLWDLLVDQQPDVCQDCRSPEYLHNLIMKSDDPEISLLHVLCDERAKKRRMEVEKPNNLFSDKPSIHKDYEPSEKDKKLLVPGRKNKL